MNDFNFDFIGGLTDFRGAGRKWHSKDLMEFCFGQIIHLCLSHLLDTSSLVASDVKTPEIFDVQTRNDLEYVKIPRDSKVKTPETPKAKEAEDQEVSFSENWEVKFPEELEATKTSEVFKVAEQSKLQQVSKVSAPKLSQVKVKKEPDVPEVLDDRSVTEVLEVHAPSEVSGIKVPEATTSEDLETEVPKVFEVKTPETLSVGSEIKIGQDASKVKTTEETKVSEFVDAQEKIDKSESQILEDTKVTEDKNKIVKRKTKKGEKDTQSNLDNK
ncbi:BnaA06g23650D [Brassica napus]|uniref:BnaA06g23650D protein n=2 Tax=Brassica napus TaxID=3708 RepID=A0A078F745_BRANA|nr:BnaA06g23650D [Brassica napus]